MKTDRSEAIEAMERIKESQGRSATVDVGRLRTLEQAEVHAQNLTRDSNWDIFLQQLQNWVELSKQNRTYFQDLIASPDVANEEIIRRARTYLQLSNHRIELLEAVIALPKQIMDAGEEAKLKLQEIGNDLMNEQK